MTLCHMSESRTQYGLCCRGSKKPSALGPSHNPRTKTTDSEHLRSMSYVCASPRYPVTFQAHPGVSGANTQLLWSSPFHSEASGPLMQGWMYQQDQNNLLETQLGFSDSSPAWIRSEYLTKDIWLHLFKFLLLDRASCCSSARVTFPSLVCSRQLGSGFSYTSLCVLLCQRDSYSRHLLLSPCPAQSLRPKNHGSFAPLVLVCSRCSMNSLKSYGIGITLRRDLLELHQPQSGSKSWHVEAGKA